MSAGMSQSMPLSAEFLEFLGDARGALKNVKQEIKETEREIKKLDKAGKDSSALQGKLATARGQRNRLQGVMDAQKEERNARRVINQKRGALRRAITAPADVLIDSAFRRLGQTATGKQAQAAVGRAAVRAASAIKGVPIGTAAAIIAAPLAGLAIAKSVSSFQRKKAELMLQQARGAAQTQSVMSTILDNAASGGATVQDASAIIAATMKANQAGSAIGEKTVRGAINRTIFGVSTQQNDMSTKLANVVARRQANIKQYGAGYGDYTDSRNITRRRAPQIKQDYLRERNSLVAEVATGIFGGSEGHDFVDPTAELWRIMTFGNVDTRAATVEAINLKYRESADKEFHEIRAAEQKAWNTNISYAVDRANANERRNAVRAYEDDKLMRFATWRQQ